MKPDRAKGKGGPSLRRRAERQIENPRRTVQEIPGEKVPDLMHELEVHQVELELQNEELRRSQEQIEAGRKKYLDLYDLAPIGYVTLDREGRIREINLTGADLLGVERRYLKGRLLARFVAEWRRDDFHRFWRRLLESGKREECEVALAPVHGSPVEVVFLGAAVPGGEDRGLCQIAIMDVSGHSRIIKELERSREELRALAARLHAVREDERTSLAREIHDELSGSLTALKMDLSLLPDRAAKDHRLFLEKLGSMCQVIDNTLNRVHSIVTELRPVVLDRLGLVAAMEWQARAFQERYKIACETRLPVEEIPLDSDRATAVFRIFQEALVNVARHANASKVAADLRQEAKNLVLQVRDDGMGIDEKKIFDQQSLGLLGMRERALVFGGTVEVRRLPHQGTEVSVTIPIG